ncbi:tellurite resistance TerB family protein [Ferrimonas balearica]|uniref:tellurite resistance TerB family protein n=1 Tax=Ferrimonas balearica TaxID=44012 RepID=UPI001C999254|nr:tellurite resistance TerB family protein [Ferrimonas balearica]MBY5993668.1 tellurite resistance TerB family protein [Ferrimonas balearica]
MKYPGIRAILIGLAMMVGTFVVLLATERLFYVVLIIGAISVLKGLFELVMYLFKSKENKEAHHVQMGLKAVYQSMLVVAMADGELDEAELATIQGIVHQLTDEVIPVETLTEAATAVGQDLKAVLKDIRQYAGQIDPEMKTLIVRAAVHVSACDGRIEASERAQVEKIASTVGVAKMEVERLYEEILSPEEDAEPTPA